MDSNINLHCSVGVVHPRLIKIENIETVNNLLLFIVDCVTVLKKEYTWCRRYLNFYTQKQKRRKISLQTPYSKIMLYVSRYFFRRHYPLNHFFWDFFF